MFHHPGHILIYDKISKYCIFDGEYLVFEKADAHTLEEDPIVAVVFNIIINQDPLQFPDKGQNAFRLFADLILEDL